MTLEVEVRNRLGRAEAALEGLDDVDLGVGEESVEVRGAATRIAGDVVVTVEDAVGELDLVTLRFPPLDAAEDSGAGVVGLAGAETPIVPPGRQRTDRRGSA